MTEGSLTSDVEDETVSSDIFKNSRKSLLDMNEEDLVTGEVNGGLRNRRPTPKTEESAIRRKDQPDKPIHSQRVSILSQSLDSSNFSGIANWATLLLLLAGVRLTLENLNKYGIRVTPKKWLLTVMEDNNPEFRWDKYSFVFLIAYLQAVVIFMFIVEKIMSENRISRKTGLSLHIGNLITMLIIPVVVIQLKYSFIGSVRGIIIVLSFTITFLKMWSYIQVNHWCHLSLSSNEQKPRKSSLSMGKDDSVKEKLLGNSDPQLVTYPNNLNLKDLYYFWYAPTLCYELNFPRNDRIRKRFLLVRFMEVIILANFSFALTQQWIIPSVVNSLVTFNKMNAGHALERILKLAIPNHLIWLIWFYILFHSLFNVLGEILKFADRNFYGEWWNATNSQIFWTNWNIPVHRWCVRHLYKPLLQIFGPNSTHFAKLCVFGFSAVFHEYLISVSLGVMRWYAFIGMIAQLPLFAISKLVEKYLGNRFGNWLVWLSLIIGQPLALLMYYHDFVVEHYGIELLKTFGTL